MGLVAQYTLPFKIPCESVMKLLQSIYILKIPDFQISHVVGPTFAPQTWKMSGTVDPMIQHNIPEDFHLQQHCCENLKSCNKPLGPGIKFHLPPFISDYILSFILNMTGSEEFLFNC